jgi:hypothetical protein
MLLAAILSKWVLGKNIGAHAAFVLGELVLLPILYHLYELGTNIGTPNMLMA